MARSQVLAGLTVELESFVRRVPDNRPHLPFHTRFPTATPTTATLQSSVPSSQWLEAVRRSVRVRLESDVYDRTADFGHRPIDGDSPESRALRLMRRFEAWLASPSVEAAMMLSLVPQLVLFFAAAIDVEVRCCIEAPQAVLRGVLVSVWAFTIYLLIRVVLRDRNDSLRVNLALFITLMVGQVLCRLREQSQAIGQVLGLSHTTWRVLFFGCVLCLALLVLIRAYITYTVIRDVGRRLVSQKRRRFVDSGLGVDLDLSYVTRNIIAMGWPTASWREQQIRNPMDQVVMVLNRRHAGRYKVYNLCAERRYNEHYFEQEFHDIRFPDHNVCKLVEVQAICRDMKAFLGSSAERRVVVVHCKAGKGRTGMIVSCLLLHLQNFTRAETALAHFGRRRTYNGKGVTIPSQIRWVSHYEAVIREGGLRPQRFLRLARIETYPKLEAQLRFQLVHPDDGVVYDTANSNFRPPVLEGDLKLVAFHGEDKLFQVWLHTAYDVLERNANVAMEVTGQGCAAGHAMRQICAYMSKRCDRCGQVVDLHCRVFECRLCDPIVWHCCKCAHGAAQNQLSGTISAILVAKRLAAWARGGTKAAGGGGSSASCSIAGSGALGSAACAASSQAAASLAGDGIPAEKALATCPRGHALDATSLTRIAWVCSACGRKSWGHQLFTRRRCAKCDYSVCEGCLSHMAQSDLDVDRCFVQWEARLKKDAFPAKAFVQRLGRRELDGPHKEKEQKARGQEGASVIAQLRELRFVFGEVEEQETFADDAVESYSYGGSEHIGTQASFCSHGSALTAMPSENLTRPRFSEAYDALEGDTDSEESLSAVCRGFLLVSPWMCSRPKMRLVELGRDGTLHIAGNRLFPVLDAQLTDGDNFREQLLGKATAQRGSAGPHDAPSRDHSSSANGAPTRTWWVRQRNWWMWQSLQAPSADEEVRWEEAFSDVFRYYEPLRPGSIFAEFFSIAVAEMHLRHPVDIHAECWRLRLLTLQDDGRVFIYSHSEAMNTHFCDVVRWIDAEGEPAVSYPTECIYLRNVRLTGTATEDHIVFQVPAPAGPEDSEASMLTLAAPVEIVLKLRAMVVGIIEKATTLLEMAGVHDRRACLPGGTA